MQLPIGPSALDLTFLALGDVDGVIRSPVSLVSTKTSLFLVRIGCRERSLNASPHDGDDRRVKEMTKG